MGYGKRNEVVLQILGQGQLTGNGNERDTIDGTVFAANKVILPFRAKLVRVDASAYAGAGAALAEIKLFNGTTKSGTAIFSAAMDLSGNSAHTTASKTATGMVNPDKIYARGQQFCISEKVTNTKTLDQLQVTLTFRKEPVED